MTSIFISTFDWTTTPLWLAATDRGLVRIEFGRNRTLAHFARSFNCQTRNNSNPILEQAISQLTSYFDGRLKAFKLNIEFLHGTPFQKAVWNEVAKIPYGRTTTYGHIARALNNPGAVRAVGAANGANPIPIIIPCHRVLASDGKLGGYSGGLDIKDELLRLEGALI